MKKDSIALIAAAAAAYWLWKKSQSKPVTYATLPSGTIISSDGLRIAADQFSTVYT